MQLSRRAGSRPRSTSKRVYLPGAPGRKIRSSSTVPARKERSKRRKRVTANGTARRSPRAGQSEPRQRSAAVAPAGARTDSSVSLAPLAVSRPPLSTTVSSGNSAGAGSGNEPWGAGGGGGAGGAAGPCAAVPPGRASTSVASAADAVPTALAQSVRLVTSSRYGRLHAT